MLFLMFIAFQKNGGVIRLTGTGGCHFVLFVPKTRKLSLCSSSGGLYLISLGS